MDKNRYKVLQIFGVPIEVNNRKLAELLVLDAMELLGSDVGSLPEVIKNAEKAMGNGGKVSGEENTGRLLSEVESIGAQLGFDVGWQGVWRSPTSMVLAVRVIDRVLPLDQAKSAVVTLAEQLDKLRGETGGIIVVPDKLSVEIFKIAVLSKNYYDRMRVATPQVLREVRSLVTKEKLSHEQVVSLLMPLASVDVGALLDAVRGGSKKRR